MNLEGYSFDDMDFVEIDVSFKLNTLGEMLVKYAFLDDKN
jgi:hypothetical protein